MNPTLLLYGAGAIVAGLLALRVKRRLELSFAKHRSLAGHARWSRRFAALVPFYEYDESEFFVSDDAPDEVAKTRRAGFMRLASIYAQRFPKSASMNAEVESTISDMQFTSRYRVPFQYSKYVRKHLKAGSFLASSSGVTVTDLDGNRLYDLSGSYGVNVFGYDFYKECIDEGSALVHDLGPVLGS